MQEKFYTNEGLTLALINNQSVVHAVKQCKALVRLQAKRRYKESIKSEADLEAAALDAIQYLIDDHYEEAGFNVNGFSNKETKAVRNG